MSLNKKVLQVVNLSPPVDESFFGKIEQMHPMRMVVYASILQVVVLFGMLGIIGLNHLFI